MKTTLVLPAFNEEQYIAELVEQGRNFVDEVIVVDDCSRDQTYKRAVESGALVLHHRINLGKACALKTGCEAAVLLNSDIIALMDSDGQHKPSDLPRFFQEMKLKRADIVIGSRSQEKKSPAVRFYGNKLLAHLVVFLHGVHVTDIQSGFRVFRSEIFPSLKWVSSNYHADAEMTVRIGKKKLTYSEIPIESIYLDKHKGMTPIDGIALAVNIIKWKFTL
jgi:glycosyltransferase involved in cell wall biosynthesis